MSRAARASSPGHPLSCCPPASCNTLPPRSPQSERSATACSARSMECSPPAGLGFEARGSVFPAGWPCVGRAVLTLITDAPAHPLRWPERQSPLAVSSTPSATGPAPTTRPTEARLPLAHQDHDQASAAELRPVLAEGNVHQQWQPDPDVVRMRSVRCGTVQGQGVF